MKREKNEKDEGELGGRRKTEKKPRRRKEL
jgi:hypothetical protein